MSDLDYIKKKRSEVDVIPAKIVPFVRAIMKFYTRLNVWVFKKSNGRWMNKFPGGAPICLVGMTGRKSGQRREVMLIHLPHGDNKLLVASQGGLDADPVWFKNIMANPHVDITANGVKKITACGRPAARKSERCGRICCPCILILMNTKRVRIAIFLC